jgi:hypothetical protein
MLHARILWHGGGRHSGGPTMPFALDAVACRRIADAAAAAATAAAARKRRGGAASEVWRGEDVCI